MLDKEKYSNGQNVYRYENNTLTYYYKSGKIKATGKFVNNLMEGEWNFYKESGLLWQIGNFKNGNKNGLWVRFDNNKNIIYKEEFIDNKIIKSK